MDWRTPAEQRLTLLETCWRLKLPSGRVISCNIYRSGPGFDVRATFGEHDLLRSERCNRIEGARDLAAQWKTNVMATGDFEELPPTAPSGQ